jgi:hypothetical protein
MMEHPRMGFVPTGVRTKPSFLILFTDHLTLWPFWYVLLAMQVIPCGLSALFLPALAFDHTINDATCFMRKNCTLESVKA